MNKEWMARWKGLGRYRYAVLTAALGALLMLLPTGRRERAEPPPAEPGCFELEAFEHRLEEALSRVTGAGAVRVVLTLDSGSRQILAQDLEQEGEERRASTTVKVGEGVVPLQTLAPSFRGALVICPGGGMPSVRLQLTEALSALTGLRADRISVCEGTGK